MFGHDNQDQQTNDQTNDAASVVTPAPDEALDTIAAADQISPVPVVSDDPPADQTGAPAVQDSTDDSTTNNDSDDLLKTDDDGLLDIKRQALQQLSPLVGHLDQSPEEKFKTTMMMIQAADDKALVQTAYDAAQQISDEKTRAQALLDVINEINYFTHPQDQDK